MIHKIIYTILATLCITNISFAQNKVVWSLGEADDKYHEFALSPSGYQDFLKNDFGWEDKFFVITHSDIKKDFPYVLPGSVDYWGGTSVLAGIRPHEINILFELEKGKSSDDWKLLIDVLDVSPENPPLLKVSVNERSWKFRLEAGTNKEGYKEITESPQEQLIQIPIPSEVLREGGNEIEITTLEGSWLLFDQLKLEGPQDANLVETRDAFVRNVVPANYTLKQGRNDIQPLLIDVEHLQNSPTLIVNLDGKPIYEKVLEQGRYELEVPMPAVKKIKASAYSIFIDGHEVTRGSIERSPQQASSLADYVDTKIGTGHSRWMIAPGPWMPFSMVKISPDNQRGGWQSGYQPTFESVGTFSHIHEWTMAGLGTFPTNGPLLTEIGIPEDPDSGYRSRVDKATEQTPLGYYSVLLTDYNIKAELTSTTRASFQRYTYPEDSEHSRILVDLQIPAEYGYDIEEAYFKVVGKNKLVGFSKQRSPHIWGEQHYRGKYIEGGGEQQIWDDIAQEYTVHFVMEFDQNIRDFGVVVTESEDSIPVSYTDRDELHVQNPQDIVAYVEFDTQQNQIVQTRTAISYVSIENAQLNLDTEITQAFGWDFDAVRAYHVNEWNQLFERVVITTDDRREKTRFYSNMYRALVSRNIFSDVDGSWVDANENIQKLADPNAVALGCDAFWNTFWNLNQFWNLVTPEWSSQWVKSQLAMYDANGWLAKGPAGMEYIPVMVAEHEIPLIVGAYQMGIRDFDAKKALQAVYKMQTTPGEQVGNGYAGNRDLPAYLQHQYVPYNKGRFSNTLEYSFDDYAVSQLAKSLGKQKIYEEFKERGYWWKNAIDSTSGFARLRHSDGSWYPDFDPIKSAGNYQYVEGNAWQLTFFVPQDIPALAEAVGGNEKLVDRLKWGFNESSSWRYNAPNELYWDFPVTQGNQQSMHFSFLFNWVGSPWLTQKWNRDIVDKYYGFGVSNAYLGDEDQGQMSAWFVMSALGLFQTDGGTSANPIYEIGSPLFEKTRINLGGRYGRGNTFVIEAKNASRLNKYVQRAKLNGKVLNNFWFPAEELLKGGTLELEMGAEPNKNWGTQSLPQK